MPVKQQARESYLTADELCTELRIDRTLLYNWNHKGVGPPYHKFGNQLRYTRADIDAWTAARRVTAADD